MGFVLTPFRGMVPRTAERLLGDGLATDATNVNLSSGEIRPIKQPLPVHTPASPGPWTAVYRAVNGSQSQWLAWTADVDTVRAPLPAASEARFCWTGDDEPRYATYSKLPDCFALGIPKPQGAASISHSGGSGAAVTRFYVYTFYSALGEEGPESPVSNVVTGKVDGTWAITGMDAFPANSGTVAGVFAAGVTTFTDTLNHWLRAGDAILLGTTKAVVASTPSAKTFTVSGDLSAETAWTRVAPWNTAGMKRRLYRTAGTEAAFQLVAEGVGTTYDDTLADTAIPGDELISQRWEPPPAALRGLIALPNGALAGFFENQLCFSEMNQPHAWPQQYRRATDVSIVGIEAYGTTVVACSKGRPYVATGAEPASVTMDSVDKVWPCLNKRSVISIGDGVLYATTYGLAYVGMGGAAIWTDALFTREEWVPLNPGGMVAAIAEGRVFVRYDGGDGFRGVLVFSPSDGGVALTKLSVVPDELYADRADGRLYMVDAGGVSLWDAGVGPRIDYAWVSKDYHLPQPMNFGAARVDFVGEMTEEDFASALAAYEANVALNQAAIGVYKGLGGINARPLNTGPVNSGPEIQNVSPPSPSVLTFTLYSDGLPVYSRTMLTSADAFRLPGGFRSESVAIGLTGSVRVKYAAIAETMSDLKAL